MKSVKQKKAVKPRLKLVKNDPWLEPYNDAIEGRHQAVVNKLHELTGGKTSLADFAEGHNYFGLHRRYFRRLLA